MAARVRAIMAATPVAGIVGALAAMRDRPDSTALLPSLAGIPTLVMVGERGPAHAADDSRRMAGAIPGARLEVIPGAAHLVSVEKARETTAVMRDF